MNSEEIANILRSNTVCKNIFGGVYSADQIPLNNIKTPLLIIVNTDLAINKGKHWVVFYFSRNHSAEFFDSAGRKPEFYHLMFKNILIEKGAGNKYMYVDKRLQKTDTMSCGEYSIFYSIHRCFGYSFREILEKFSDNLEINERIVSTFLYRIKHRAGPY